MVLYVKYIHFVLKLENRVIAICKNRFPTIRFLKIVSGISRPRPRIFYYRPHSHMTSSPQIRSFDSSEATSTALRILMFVDHRALNTDNRACGFTILVRVLRV